MGGRDSAVRLGGMCYQASTNNGSEVSKAGGEKGRKITCRRPRGEEVRYGDGLRNDLKRVGATLPFSATGTASAVCRSREGGLGTPPVRGLSFIGPEVSFEEGAHVRVGKLDEPLGQVNQRTPMAHRPVAYLPNRPIEDIDDDSHIGLLFGIV